MALYHPCPVLLAPGSIVLPGNYGRVIRQVGPPHAQWPREQELENVRQQQFPDKPSRLESAFACTNLDAARFYMNVPQVCVHFHSALYEVEKVDAEAPEHRADFNVVEVLPGRPETMTQMAMRYWAANLWVRVADRPDIRCEELVTLSPLRIIRRVQ